MEKVTCKKGEELYNQSRDQLREMLGISEGVRLYSQLQADKKRVWQIRMLQPLVMAQRGILTSVVDYCFAGPKGRWSRKSIRFSGEYTVATISTMPCKLVDDKSYSQGLTQNVAYYSYRTLKRGLAFSVKQKHQNLHMIHIYFLSCLPPIIYTLR